MRFKDPLAAAALASVIALAGCSKARPLQLPPDPAGGCTSCHGGQENSTSAPPYSLPRNSVGDISASGNRFGADANMTQIAVGAHTRHVVRGVSCGSCHIVPGRILAPGHDVGQRATVIFNEVAVAGGVHPPPWDPAVHSCSNYCHGVSLGANGDHLTPDWLEGPAGAGCGACHFDAGAAPPSTHPQGPGAGGAFAANTDCAVCHVDTVDILTGDINVLGGKHVNGVIDGGTGGHSPGWADPANHGPAANAGLPGCAVCHGTDFSGGTSTVSCTACHTTNGHPDWRSECTFCHGDSTRAADARFPLVGAASVQVRANLAAPPRGAQIGNVLTLSVGTHQTHLNVGNFASGFLCDQCHGATLPADTSHVIGTVTISWGSVAAASGTIPTPLAGNLPLWTDTTTTPAETTCANYCHAPNTSDTTARITPSWTGGAIIVCGSCHGLPPLTAAHPSSAPLCSTCHSGYADAPSITSTASALNMATHVNGVIDVASMSCTACHGTAGRTGVTGADANVAAAPPIATLGHDTAVGAHQPHVNQGATAPPLSAPFACPVCHSGVVPTAAPHGVPASPVVFGGLAITGSAAAGYVKATQNCSSTYCHGNFTGGNGATTVTWGTAGKLTCTGCHGTPPTATDPAHPADTNCGLCHTGYTISAVNPTTHVNGLVDVVGGGDCVGCHTTAQTMAAGGTRRAIVPEFALAWSHKRSAAGVVTKWDCIVCHMEGDASGNPSAVHRDGVIDLRDPDTGTTIQGVTWGGTGAGAYTSTGTALTFARFSRDLGNATLEPAVQAIMINQCLKCHDVDGAVSLLARVPTGTAEKPFGTTIAGAGYTGAGVTAAGVAGGVTDVSNSFSTANASYHPVLGKANNSYVSNSRMSAPWNALSPDKTAGTTTSWGYLISCWDCHAPAGATGVQTSTVTAHGGAATLRGNIWANPAALCKTCHIAYTSGSAHGVGSAFNSSVNSGMNTYIQNQCHYCHSSGVTRPTRPQPAQDVHGFDLFAPTAGAGDTMWPAGTANTYKPYAFMRSVGSALGGRWTSTSWKPLSGPGVPTGSATCGGSMSTCSGENMSGYSPGGTY